MSRQSNMEYTKEYLKRLIADKIEEGGEIEYKAAKALSREEGKTTELTKDISALANAAGGVLIYGVAEFDDKAKRHLPERLDPVDQTQFSKEWLDQKIGLIKPRIEGLKITPVHVGPAVSDYCYVVEVPQSGTAHQARDFRYYRRRNFEVTPMEDYEVRDVMNRRFDPVISVEIRIVPQSGNREELAHVAVKVSNVSPVMAKHYKVVVEMPLRLSTGRLIKPEGAELRHLSEGFSAWSFVCNNQGSGPLFPDSEYVHGVKLAYKQDVFPEPPPSIQTIHITVFADKMKRLELIKNAAQAEQEWV